MKAKPKVITIVLFDGQSFPIAASDGKKIISLGKNIIWFCSDFTRFGLDKPSQSTKKVDVVIHEMTADGTFLEVFSGINPDLSKLVMTMANILDFCEQHPNKLHQDGFGTFFLTEKKLNIFQKIFRHLFNRKLEYFVTRVYVHSVGLSVYVHRLECSFVWLAEYRHRVVSLRCAPLKA